MIKYCRRFWNSSSSIKTFFLSFSYRNLKIFISNKKIWKSVIFRIIFLPGPGWNILLIKKFSSFIPSRSQLIWDLDRVQNARVYGTIETSFLFRNQTVTFSKRHLKALKRALIIFKRLKKYLWTLFVLNHFRHNRLWPFLKRSWNC